jgi:hypothetical protein
MSGTNLVSKKKDMSPWQVIIVLKYCFFLKIFTGGPGGLFVRVSAVFNMTHFRKALAWRETCDSKIMKKLPFISPW